MDTGWYSDSDIFGIIMFLTCLLLFGFQEAADEQVNSADCIVCPFTQGSDKMFHVLSQVSKQKCTWVRYWRLDDGRDGLETQIKWMTDQTPPFKMQTARYQQCYNTSTIGLLFFCCTYKHSRICCRVKDLH